MLLGLVIFILGVIVAVVLLGFALYAFSESEVGTGILCTIVAVVVGGGFIVGPCVGSVGTRKVGVVTSFNKPTGDYEQAGAYFMAPWKQVHEMDLAAQTEPYQLEVQAAGGTTIGLAIAPRWYIVPAKAPDLFQNYRSFDGVINNLFLTELRDASNKLFAAYNPLTNLDPKTGEPIKSKEEWAAQLRTELENRLAGSIVFERLAITTIAPDPKTQEKLNQQVEEFGRGKVLDQQKINAEKQKAITETNAKVDKVTRCLEIAEKTGGEPGLCMGGNSGVIVNTNTK